MPTKTRQATIENATAEKLKKQNIKINNIMINIPVNTKNHYENETNILIGSINS